MIGRMDADSGTWRPQAFGRRRASDIADPVIEPAWSGLRVIAHLDAAAARAIIRDEDGEDLAADHAPVAQALLAALAAETAVLDGYLTDQATRSSAGLAIAEAETPSFGALASQMFLGRRVESVTGSRLWPRELDGPRPADGAGGDGDETPIAFVAVDLLALDGEPLVGIPLLERKRLMESVLTEGELVRRTPYVRPPASPFILTWRSLGFGGLAYKAANSRYLPGARNDEWCLARMPRR
jgi:bifunctional non-homologous end joining protein LigD